MAAVAVVPVVVVAALFFRFLLPVVEGSFGSFGFLAFDRFGPALPLPPLPTGGAGVAATSTGVAAGGKPASGCQDMVRGQGVRVCIAARERVRNPASYFRRDPPGRRRYRRQACVLDWTGCRLARYLKQLWVGGQEMGSRTTEKMTNAIDSSAWSKYSDKFNGPSGKPLTLPMVRSAFEAQWFSKLDADIAAKRAPLNVLCLACGTGAEVDVLCGRYDETQMSVLATDFAPGMVDATKRLVAQAGKEAMVQTKVMDAMVSRANGWYKTGQCRTDSVCSRLAEHRGRRRRL